MDGFHLSNATLDRLGLRDRKGAVETFDGWGFLALLRRLLAETDHPVYAPGFDRAVDEGVTGQVAVPPSARLVVVEGNYLLVDRQPWAQVADVLAETWFCDTPEAERVHRLVTRHEPAAARRRPRGRGRGRRRAQRAAHRGHPWAGRPADQRYGAVGAGAGSGLTGAASTAPRAETGDRSTTASTSARR